MTLKASPKKDLETATKVLRLMKVNVRDLLNDQED